MYVCMCVCVCVCVIVSSCSMCPGDAVFKTVEGDSGKLQCFQSTLAGHLQNKERNPMPSLYPEARSCNLVT